MLNFLKKTPRFLGAFRKIEFGKFTFEGFEFKGNEDGRWFSVDENGKVRAHHFQTSGAYRFTRMGRKSTFRSKGRS